MSETKPPEVLRAGQKLCGLHLVDRKKHRLAAAKQQPRQLHIGRSQLRSSVNDHHDNVSLIERNLSLPEDLARYQRLIIRNHAAGIDKPNVASSPLDLAVDAVARNARFIADDRAPRTCKPIE